MLKIDANQANKYDLKHKCCDWYFRDTYIVVKWTFTITNPDNDVYDKKLEFKNNAPFVFCISEINYTLVDNAEDLDIVMPMYNLLQYSKKYSIKIQNRLITKQVLQEN